MGSSGMGGEASAGGDEGALLWARGAGEASSRTTEDADAGIVKVVRKTDTLLE